MFSPANRKVWWFSGITRSGSGLPYFPRFGAGRGALAALKSTFGAASARHRFDGLTWVAVAGSALALVVCAAPVHAGGGWQSTTASAYSRHSSGSTNGCDGSTLHDGDLSVTTFLVPCGARLQICSGGRCVRVVRRDSGPYVRGRGIDVNVGVARALGYSSEAEWGVRVVRWRRLG